MSAIHSSRQVSTCCSEHHDALVSSNLAISPVGGEIHRLHWWHAAPYPIGVSPIPTSELYPTPDSFSMEGSPNQMTTAAKELLRANAEIACL